MPSSNSSSAGFDDVVEVEEDVKEDLDEDPVVDFDAAVPRAFALEVLVGVPTAEPSVTVATPVEPSLADGAHPATSAASGTTTTKDFHEASNILFMLRWGSLSDNACVAGVRDGRPLGHRTEALLGKTPHKNSRIPSCQCRHSELILRA